MDLELKSSKSIISSDFVSQNLKIQLSDYGLKFKKDACPKRPILSAINTFNYNLAKFLFLFCPI